MADELQGGLTLVGAAPGAPNPATNPLAALQAQTLGQMEKKQSYLEQQQAAYNRDMEQYTQMVAQSRRPEANEAGMWGAMAGAAADVSPQWGNIGQMIGKTGAAYGGFQEQQQAQDLKNQGDLTKMRQAEVRALEAKDQSAAILKSMMPGNKGFEPRRNADGTTTVFDKNTGIPVGTYGPQDIGKITQLTQTLAKAAFDKGDYKTLDEALQWAHGEAIRIVTASGGAMGNRTKPLTGDIGGVPTTPPPAATPTPAGFPRVSAQEQAGRDAEREAIRLRETEAARKERDAALASGNAPAATQAGANLASLHTELANTIAALPAAQRADADRNFQRYIANPNQGTLSALEASLTRVGAMPKLDVVRRAGETETSKETAKTYADLFTENVAKPAQAFSNTGKIMQDFNTLGQMQYALKNGKLKEFMAGDAGKYALSFLPESSDLRKGIANAQEAEKLTAGMVNQILMAAKGVQTEGDAQRARSQVTSIGTDPDANAYLEAYISETARQLKMRERAGLEHKNVRGTFEGYDESWSNSPLMKEAKGSVKKLGSQWIGVTQYIDKFKAKNPGATDSDAVKSWNRVNP